jgi:hypothetical protein
MAAGFIGVRKQSQPRRSFNEGTSMNKSGNISAKESGEAEFSLPIKPNFVECMFVDGLPDDPCGHVALDRVVCNIKTVTVADDEDLGGRDAIVFYTIKITWQISKPRLIWWQVTD